MRIPAPAALVLAGLALLLSACSGGDASADTAAPGDAATAWLADPVSSESLTLLENPGFRIGYSDARRQPLWVSFEARSVAGKPRLGPRPQYFDKDERVARPVKHGDYSTRAKRPAYTRGHLAPNYLIGKLHGADGQRHTFLMSNVSPQAPRLNALLWQRLEEAEVDRIAPALGALRVFTGPVFGPDAPQLKKTGIAIPEAFYRVWVDELPSGELRVLAFLVPQNVCGEEPLSRFLVPVDQIEARTSLDFLAPLPDPLEQTLESTVRSSGWHLEKVDRQPPRYGKDFEGEHCNTPDRGTG